MTDQAPELLPWRDIKTAPRGTTLCVARKGGQRDDGSTYWYQGTGHFGLTDGHFHKGYGELYGDPELWTPYPENPEHCTRPTPAEPLPQVQRIEMVRQEGLNEVAADPIWRLEIGGICADFGTETAANNFRNAIVALLPTERPVPQVREALASVGLKIAEKISQLRHYRDNQAQLDHAKTIADGRISQAEMDLRWVKEALAALTARPSDAAVAWRSDLDEIQLLINGYDRNNSDWGFRSRVISEIISKLRLALPPDEPARVTPSTVGGEALDARVVAEVIIDAAFNETNPPAKRPRAKGDRRELMVEILADCIRKRLSPTIASEKECGKAVGENYSAWRAELEKARSQLVRAKGYVTKSIASYEGDPASNDFQRGFLAALEVIRDEAFAHPDEVQL